MSDNIRLTYVPYSNMDEGFYQGIIDVVEYVNCVTNPFILYNKELDINVENLDSIINEYTEYIDADELYDKLENIVKTNNSDEGYSIMLYGFDLSLDDIKEKIAPKINQNVYLFVNIIVDDDNYACSSSIGLSTDIVGESNEEWKKHKEEIHEELKRIENVYQRLNNLFKDFTSPNNKSKKEEIDAPVKIKLLGYEEPKENKAIKVPAIKPKDDIEDSKLDDNFVCYTYEDIDNIVSVVRSGNIFSIEDDDNRVEFDKKALDFIIESLMKFYDK